MVYFSYPFLWFLLLFQILKSPFPLFFMEIDSVGFEP